MKIQFTDCGVLPLMQLAHHKVSAFIGALYFPNGPCAKNKERSEKYG
jgi:hypothetical protein